MVDETEDQTKAVEIVDALVRATNTLPLVHQLEIVKNIIFDHGGSIGSVPCNLALVGAYQLLERIIDNVIEHPQLAARTSPAP